MVKMICGLKMRAGTVGFHGRNIVMEHLDQIQDVERAESVKRGQEMVQMTCILEKEYSMSLCLAVVGFLYSTGTMLVVLVHHQEVVAILVHHMFLNSAPMRVMLG